MNAWRFSDLKMQAIEAECFETPTDAVTAVFKCEILTRRVVDPCCGRGVLSHVAEANGHDVISFDKYDWGFGVRGIDFLTDPRAAHYFGGTCTVLMNPPFSLAEEFVLRALSLGARKIVCYQRFAWFESKKRREFWNANPPNRIYVTAERMDCWRIDIPPEARLGSRPYPHAWYVWEAGQPTGTLLARLERP